MKRNLTSVCKNGNQREFRSLVLFVMLFLVNNELSLFKMSYPSLMASSIFLAGLSCRARLAVLLNDGRVSAGGLDKGIARLPGFHVCVGSGEEWYT